MQRYFDFAFDFLQFALVKSLKIIIIKNCPVHHLKAKKEGLHGRFSRYLQFCVFFFYLKFGLKHLFFYFLLFFFYLQAPGRAQIRLTVHQIFENSTEGNVTNLTRKMSQNIM